MLRPHRERLDILWGDLRDPATVERAVDGVDVVIHLAALIPPAADRHPAQAESVNVGGTRALVEAMKRAPRPARLIHASSISVYGDRLEDYWIQGGDPVNASPHDEYGETKIRGEAIVRESGLWWSIFRLTGVIGPGMGMDPLMFHVPLETKLEVVTRRDCGAAFAAAINSDGLEGRVFNLGGGSTCRTTYREFLDRILDVSGMGRRCFPDEAFAGGNFHCGWYRDSGDLEDLLGFQKESLDELVRQMGESFPAAQIVATRVLRPVIRTALLRFSEPYRARQRNDRAVLERFCLSPDAAANSAVHSTKR